MPLDEVPEPLATVLRTRFNVELFHEGWDERVRAYLRGDPALASAFRAQLAAAIVHHTMTPEQYDELTRDRYPSAEALEEWLRKAWRDLFGAVPPESCV